MQISESVPLAGSYLWFSREAPGSSPWTSCRSVSLHGPRCSQDSLVHSSPPPLWLMVSCRGFSRGLWGPQEWQSHRKGRFWVPDLTALMRTAPWPGTPVETLYEWKRNFCCVCLLKQLPYQITVLATVLWAALRTFWSLRDNQSKEGHEPPRCWAPLSLVV